MTSATSFAVTEHVNAWHGQEKPMTLNQHGAPMCHGVEMSPHPNTSSWVCAWCQAKVSHSAVIVERERQAKEKA